MPSVKFGVRIPFSGPASTTERLREAAIEAEALGYHAVFAQDHIDKSFERGRHSPIASGSVLDPSNKDEPVMNEAITSLAFLAGITSKIDLATGVTPLPLREPVVLAKQLATIDCHSGGRLIFGVGVANVTDKQEFANLNVPFLPYAQRYQLAGEYIAAMREIWEQPTASFDGEHVKFQNLTIYPKPAHRIPIWLGAGTLAGGLERPPVRFAVDHADGVMPPYLMKSHEFREMVDDFTRTAASVGRDISDFAWCTQRRMSIGTTMDEARANMEWVAREQENMWQHVGYMHDRGKGGAVAATVEMMTLGTPKEIRGLVQEWIDAGANYFDCTFAFRTFDIFMRQLRLFGEQVMPHFR